MPRLSSLFAQSDSPDVTTVDPGLAPGEVSPGINGVRVAPSTQRRVMLADRATVRYQPAPSYANTDPQKGGAPGDADGSTGITSQSPTGVTTAAGVPSSPYTLSYGEATWITATPTSIAHHQTIKRWSNPNRPQVTPTPDHPIGPEMNTVYVQPGPWASGIYLGE